MLVLDCYRVGMWLGFGELILDCFRVGSSFATVPLVNCLRGLSFGLWLANHFCFKIGSQCLISSFCDG